MIGMIPEPELFIFSPFRHLKDRKRCDLISGFTRDYEQIKAKLLQIDNVGEQDRSLLGAALNKVYNLILDEWGTNTLTQILLVTDGYPGMGAFALKDTIERNLIPTPLCAKMNLALLSNFDDPVLIQNKYYYKKLLTYTETEGYIYSIENGTNLENCLNMFKKIVQECYQPYNVILHCGSLQSQITLLPTPLSFTKVNDFVYKKYQISKDIYTCGFISMQDVGSPLAISRHLVIPTSSMSQGIKHPMTDEQGIMIIDDDLNNSETDESKIPSICVLLHGALKIENKTALIKLNQSNEWYGFLYSWADTKKKSNLMLTVLPPGSDSIPWLGDLNNVDILEDGGIPQDLILSFPIKPTDKKSYSQNLVVWIKETGLQSDIQKILRHARKLPEKTQQFYKELNRLRRAAIALGFVELLEGLSFIFERECQLLPGNLHPDVAVQLTHAANELKKSNSRDFKVNIFPLPTNYNAL